MPRKPASAAGPDIIPLLRAAFARHQAGDRQAAKTGYQSALSKSPDHPEALYLAGALDHELGDHAEAVRKLERSLTIRPNHIPALEMLGIAAAQTGQLDLAAASFATVAALKPQSPDPYYNQGVVLFRAGRYADAVEPLQKAITLAPTHAGALYMLANALRLQALWTAAAEVYATLAALEPPHPQALDEYGGVLSELGCRDDAVKVIEKAIAVAPHLANPYTNLGRLYQSSIADAEKALSLHEKAIACDPNHADAHNNRGVALQLLNRHQEALASYDRAIALKPNYAEAHRNKGLTSLLLGDWQTGWRENEWRLKCGDEAQHMRHFCQPTWDGTPPTAPVLVWAQQGIGDEILYGAMVAEMAARGYPLVWDMDARLQPLVARALPDLRTVPRATAVPDITTQISAPSLGKYFRPTRESFPATPHRYLRADDRRTGVYRSQLIAGGFERVIGISWKSANPRFGTHKSSPLSAWRPIWDAAGPKTRFVNLQYGEVSADCLQSGLDLASIQGLDLLEDIDGLAALVAACDQVITVSNTTAHLACALNIPTAILVPTGNGQLWYWGHEGDSTPWYPSARIFRQREPGQWRDVLDAVAHHVTRAP